jgi:glycosyltransferase involved in cell wall biosynthesis
MVRWIYRHCDLIFVQSRAFIQPVQEQGVPAGKIEYLPNTAESFYRPVTVEPGAPERSELPQGFRIVFAGNIGAAQDFPTMLAAAEMTRDDPDIHWIVFGDGRVKPWLESEVAARGLQDTFHLMGSRPGEEMPRYFALADALLVTLRRDPIFSYTIPSKIQSYLGCGRPIIAALEGEGARVIEESLAGYVVAPEDPAALAAAARKLRGLSHSDLLNMGAKGAEYFVQHFERSRVLDQLERRLIGLGTKS